MPSFCVCVSSETPNQSLCKGSHTVAKSKQLHKEWIPGDKQLVSREGS